MRIWAKGPPVTQAWLRRSLTKRCSSGLSQPSTIFMSDELFFIIYLYHEMTNSGLWYSSNVFVVSYWNECVHTITSESVFNWPSNTSHVLTQAAALNSVTRMNRNAFVCIILCLPLLVKLSSAQSKKFVCSYSPTKATQIGYQPDYIPLEICPYVIFKAFRCCSM